MTNRPLNLEQQINTAQSTLSSQAAAEASRIEWAQAATCRAVAAATLGFTLACSNTQPGTASRRNMERHGFSVAYPKVVMRVDG